MRVQELKYLFYILGAPDNVDSSFENTLKSEVILNTSQTTIYLTAPSDILITCDTFYKKICRSTYLSIVFALSFRKQLNYE